MSASYDLSPRCDASVGKHDASCSAYARYTVVTAFGSHMHYCRSHVRRAYSARYTTQPPRSVTKYGTFQPISAQSSEVQS